MSTINKLVLYKSKSKLQMWQEDPKMATKQVLLAFTRGFELGVCVR